MTLSDKIISITIGFGLIVLIVYSIMRLLKKRSLVRSTSGSRKVSSFRDSIGCYLTALGGAIIAIIFTGPVGILLAVGFGLWMIIGAIADAFRLPSGSASYSPPVNTTLDESGSFSGYTEPTLSGKEQREEWREERRQEAQWEADFREKHGRDPDFEEQWTRNWPIK